MPSYELDGADLSAVSIRHDAQHMVGGIVTLPSKA